MHRNSFSSRKGQALLRLPFLAIVYSIFEVPPRKYLVKSIPDGSLYLGPFFKSDCSPLSGTPSHKTTCPVGGCRNGESEQKHGDRMELRTPG